MLLAPLNALRRYHHHRVVGAENIPAEGGALIVTNHSFVTYDSFMLGAAILEKRHRHVRALGHSLLFRIPGLSQLMDDAGVVPASPGSAAALLKKGHLLGIAPGGMREALRPREEKYEIKWSERKGFVRLAISSGCPVILAACPEADDIVDVHAGLLTALAYETLHLPLAFGLGWNGLPIPRPIKLTHRLSKPFYPPKAPKKGKKFEAAVDAWHAELSAAMREMMRVGDRT
ncbi:MAG: lysophospholipid acyltransferase family protein [Bdellovibrionota bacterium]